MTLAVGLEVQEVALAPHHKASVGGIGMEFGRVFEVYVVSEDHNGMVWS